MTYAFNPEMFAEKGKVAAQVMQQVMQKVGSQQMHLLEQRVATLSEYLQGLSGVRKMEDFATSQTQLWSKLAQQGVEYAQGSMGIFMDAIKSCGVFGGDLCCGHKDKEHAGSSDKK